MSFSEHQRAEMQAALDATWLNEDPAAKSFRDALFPEGKPTLEDFIVRMSDYVQQLRHAPSSVKQSIRYR